LCLEGVTQFLGTGIFAGGGRQAAAVGVEEVLALVAAHDGELHLIDGDEFLEREAEG